MSKIARPWWRHWHVEGRNFGYTRKQARAIALDEMRVTGRSHTVERCDEDHSIKATVAAIRAQDL